MRAMSSGSNPQVTSPTRLRQIALVAEDLKAAENVLTRVIGTEVVFVDPAVGVWGLENILLTIGGDFLEVVSPTKPGTTAGRLLSKRGDGGYMIIMQTADAVSRRKHIEAQGLAKVIFNKESEHSVCIQYHPKGIKGGMMPELDSHKPTPTNPDPVNTRFSPWHACGPDYSSYSRGMHRTSHLRLASVVCRLAPGDTDTESALQQWNSTFGVLRTREHLQFANARMAFVQGQDGQTEGLCSVGILVKGEDRLRGVFERARALGLQCGEGWVEMVGVKWVFMIDEDGEGDKMVSKL